MKYTRTTIKAHEIRQDDVIDCSDPGGHQVFRVVTTVDDITQFVNDCPNGLLEIGLEDGTHITRHPFDYVEVFRPPVM